jgi:hypothetical protein
MLDLVQEKYTWPRFDEYMELFLAQEDSHWPRLIKTQG